MKWALTADCQFNIQLRYSVLLPDGITSRLRDTVDAFRWVVDTALDLGCEGMHVLGDIFDSRTSIDVSVIDQTCRAFEYAAKHMQVHALVGNHDSYLRTPALHSLGALQAHARVHSEVAHFGEFVFVPWTDDPEQYAAFVGVAEGYTRKKKNPATVMLSHALFEGAVPAGKGLPMSLLSDQWEAVFLGDVHDPITLRDDPLVQYCGAPLQIHFGDAGGTRGFWTYDDKTGEVEFVENEISPRFHVVQSKGDLDAIEPTTDRDFFRIRGSAATEEVFAEIRSKSTWVESEVRPDEFEKPRIDVSTSMSDEELLRKYCKHLGKSSDALIKSGLGVLEEARGAE